MEIDERFMRRALQLAECGRPYASPNPMVGAVIVRNRHIIGEGYHRRCGEGHAEVNAVASVSDKSLLRDSTMYVTLEPCSHYGKTPPCAKLIIDMHIPQVVVGCLDPFSLVAGRGIKMLRDAGVEVAVGVLEADCRELNRKFFTAHLLHRPYVTLKWAQSADGYLDVRRLPSEPAMRFSTPLSALEVHRLRSLNDAIMVGSSTVIADNPKLNVRHTSGRQPIKVVVDRRGRVPSDAQVFFSGRVIYFSSVNRRDLPDNVEIILVSEPEPVSAMLSRLYDMGITSVLVEGGVSLLRSFVDDELYDCARIEISHINLGAAGVAYMSMPPQAPDSAREVDGNLIIGVKNRIKGGVS